MCRRVHLTEVVDGEVDGDERQEGCGHERPEVCKRGRHDGE